MAPQDWWNDWKRAGKLTPAPVAGVVPTIGMIPDATLIDVDADNDHDGLPDSWELQFFGHLGYGAADDPDGDGLSNIEEYTLSATHRQTSDVNSPLYWLDPSQADTDGDDMPDGWEQQIIEASNGSFTTVFQVKPDDDFDADGMSNYAEYQAGTSPIDSESRLFVACSMNDATRELVWYGVSNRCYQVVYASELGAEWNPVDGEVIMGEDKEITYAVSLDLTNCFFRVRCAMDSADFS